METPAYTVSELMACVFSRDMQDGERGGIPGVRSEVPLASAGLAVRHHAPNATIFSPSGPVAAEQLVMTGTTTDYERTTGVASMIALDEIFDLIHRGTFDWWFAGGMQIDQYGNINLVGIGDWKRPKLRGPGTAGIASENFVGRILVWINEHSPRMFVKKVDFVSCAGHGPHDRKALGLRGGGPYLVVSPLAVLDFEKKSGRMRLRSVHPGVTVKQVQENTDFELIIPENVPTTPPPSDEEITILRKQVDPLGILREEELYG